MQKIQRFQPGQLVRAFKQAPWRVETQVIAALAAIMVVVIAISGMYLAEASRAAVAGRDVQSLEEQRDDLLRQNDLLRAEIARVQSVARVEERAREMGFTPATIDNLEFLAISENIFATQMPAVTANDNQPVSDIPAYNETLGEWLMRNLDSAMGGD